MGTAYYIVLETEIDGLSTAMGGKMLARHIEALDVEAQRTGVCPLSEFISMDVDSLVDLLGDDAADMAVPPLQQFSAHDGLATVRALLPLLEARPAIDDLRDCERILAAAEKLGVAWHFQIDI